MNAHFRCCRISRSILAGLAFFAPRAIALAAMFTAVSTLCGSTPMASADTFVTIQGQVAGFTEQSLMIDSGADSYYVALSALPSKVRDEVSQVGARVSLRLPASLVQVRTTVEGRPRLTPLLRTSRLPASLPAAP